ncbi:MAG: hydroxymethylbilane synthase [Methylophilaceae bacterium]|jgi:hydroxymethylbilane synthase|tara:strand:+ start:1590 stop:2507 length:918 start_codon:yes stop_codon:yes gene_type:complete
MIKKITIASRESPLAMWQAEHIKTQLNLLYPDLTIQIKGFKTQGDIILDKSLATIGGKGLFIKELEQALLNKDADLAVHSMKDLPMNIMEDFQLAAITKREDPRDAFISELYNSLDDLPAGSVVGTSSLRRQSQIKAKYPHLEIRPLRGNLQTRLNKLKKGDYAAIILAAAGLIRLGLKEKITMFLETNISIPAVGQGALGIEILSGNEELHTLIKPLNDENSARCVLAERMVSRSLAGSCTVPLGAYAFIEKESLIINGFVATPDGNHFIHAETKGDKAQFYSLGESLSQLLIDQGAKELLSEL